MARSDKQGRLRVSRPEMPDIVSGFSSCQSFVPAPEVAEWVESIFFDPSSPVANPEHDHLANAHIGYLWTVVENNRKGKRINPAV